ncbi:MAG: glutathione S-transferase [Deltaproteobacteria bacterium]|nr:glutathione S-transferase [Deltaproteobacteria bacterium]
MKVHGVSVSYFTGKLEAYLRYKGIRYDLAPPYGDQERIRAKVGAIQVPIVERDDGRWMSDSTPIILQLEKEHPAPSIMPGDPVVRFLAMLIEDYADEWLWRPAMHYRWSYEHDRELLSRILVDEATQHSSLPRFVKRIIIKRRQRIGFVVNDGVRRETRDHVESSYLNALRNMTAMLEERAYLLGSTPSVADFGLMGPMLRHFGQDPTPAEIMRNEAPTVYEWVARVWNASHTAGEPSFVDDFPADGAGMLKEIAETHLVQLAANAEAHGRDLRHFEMNVQGTQYRRLPVSVYRVYCLERLREAFGTLSAEQQKDVRALLPGQEAEILWQESIPAHSGYDEAREAPFNKAINVYGDGVPK